ncbi:MAG: IS1096 element passenger TnpR family protein [Pirellulaceae bacterium]
MEAKKRQSFGKREAKMRFTVRQGQVLAFIDAHCRLKRCEPSAADVADYFHITPPRANQVLARLEEKGLVARQAGVSGSVRVSIPQHAIPALEDLDIPPTPSKPADLPVDPRAAGRLYTLEVFLIGGPVPKSFAGKVISRTIQMRGNQTLQDLHRVIFEAFDRWDEHAYEFQFPKGPKESHGKRYVLPHMLDMRDKQPTIAGDVTRATLDSLGLSVENPFRYWFDYGDDWWHQIDVTSIDEGTASGTFPKIVKRLGKSPPQYMDEDD